MRLYANQLLAIEHVILEVISYQQVLDGAIKLQVDKNKKWGAKDRKNFYQAAYDIIRNYELLKYIQEQEKHKDVIDTYLAYTPDKIFEIDTILAKYPNLPIDIRYSMPKTVYDIYTKEVEHADENIIAMHAIGDIYLRINTSLVSMEKFEQKLNFHEVPYELISEIKVQDRTFQLNCIKLNERTTKFREFFEKNDDFYEIQDIGSQILTEFIDLSAANTIIESCAGNGGKTSHLMDKTREKNPLILAFDTEKKKIEHLQKRLSKWKNHKLVTEQAKEKEIVKYDNIGDILYMDMPCTGSGTLKRQSDLKYRISEKNIAEKTSQQQLVFNLFNATLKSGGTLVYSTCSLFKSENEAQLEFIISQGYELIDKLILEPKDYPGDGFFVAKLKKK
jgi:16S rRNA (cytosine967-C5)-methyltransferase